MRPTRRSDHKLPTDPVPFIATLLSDTLSVEDSFGKPVGGASTSTSVAGSFSLMRRSVDSVFDHGESPSRQHIEYAPSDVGSDNTVLAARTNAPHVETMKDESDTDSDFSDDDDPCTTEPQETQDPATGPSHTTTSAILAPIHYFVTRAHTVPNGTPIARNRTINGTSIYSPVDSMVADVLHAQRDMDKQTEKLRNAAKYDAHVASSHAGQKSALVGPPPKFILPKGPRELRRQNHQAPHASPIATHPSPPLRTVQVRRTKYVVPRIVSRTGSVFTDDPYVSEPTPTVEEVPSWPYERVLMAKEEYDQKVAAKADDETSTSTPLHNNPVPDFAQYADQDSPGSDFRAAANFMSALSPFARTPLLNMSGTDGNKPQDIDEGAEESFNYSNQNNQALLSSIAFGGSPKTKNNPTQAEVFATRRMSLKKQLAAVAIQRKEIPQREQDEIDAWKASVSFEGAQLIEELQEVIAAAKERTELRHSVLDGESRTIQSRLNRLVFIERGGKGPLHL